MKHRAIPVGFACVAVGLLWPSGAPAQQGQSEASISPNPDEGVLGTVEVDGSAGTAVPLPKLALVPLISSGNADTIARVVVRGDLTLSGQFEVLEDAKAPPGPYFLDTPIDLASWRKKAGAEYVIRAYARMVKGASKQFELVGEVYLSSASGQTKSQNEPLQDIGTKTAARPSPLFKTVVPFVGDAYRAAAHQLVDQILGATTGRPGGFASTMTYAGRVGRWRRAYLVDADGFNLRAVGPDDTTILSPAMGPGGSLFYAISRDFSPFRLAFGPQAAPFHLNVPGSVMGLAFSGDLAEMALTIMDHGQSFIYRARGGRIDQVGTRPFANHPAFGPNGRLAYAGGENVQRIYVDGKPISPPGFMASAPVFCDTQQGLLVFYSVRVAGGTDIVASNPSGGSARRFTQRQGFNAYPACSPDGRLIAFFSSGAGVKKPGLYVMPIARPWLAKRVSSLVGDSLRWSSMDAAPGATLSDVTGGNRLTTQR